jgi:two-component system cell cycle sensor histidine kinase/response regulator CckA
VATAVAEDAPMVAEAEQTEQFRSRATECPKSWWISFLRIVTWIPAGIAGGAGILCLTRVTSGWTSEIATFATIAFAVLSVIAALAGRSVNLAFSTRLDVFSRALEAASEALLIVTCDERMTYANRAFTQFFPGGTEWPLDRVQRALWSDAEAQDQFRRLRSCAAAGTPATATVSLCIEPSSSPSRFRISVDSVAECPEYRSWLFEDTAARHEIETAIHGEHCQFSDLLDSVKIGFYSVDGDGRFQSINETLASWLGSSAREMTAGETYLHEFLAIAPSDGAKPFEPFAATGEGTHDAEIVLRSRRGDVVPAWIGQSVTGSGRELRTRSVVRDFAPELASKNALKSSERLRRCFSNAPVGIALLDRYGRFEEANRAVGDLFGTTPENLRGQELIGLLDDEDRGRIAAKLAAAAGGHPDSEPFEVRPRRSNDRTMVLYLSRLDDGSDTKSPAVPSTAADAPNGLTLHFIDVTEQKNLEIQFAQSQKMQAVGQLAGGVAHDFNNLLTAMIGFCDLLLLRSPPGDPSFADIMQIKQNANRAANLVRQLLAFSRQQTLQPRVLDITDVLYELRHLIERLIGENIKLDVVHSRDLGLAKVDQGQFEQVIINLAVNARDAMPNGGVLTIRTANIRQDHELRRGHELMPAGDYVLIQVADTGIGIPKENLARIFDPFFSTKELGSGTGLGLSTVYGIVKQTGGFIFVDSKPGQGAVFEIYLPRFYLEGAGSPVRADAGEVVVSKDLTGHGTIMLVEDDDPVRIFGARALRNKGYKVIEAKSGDAALDLIRNAEEAIDLLITDVVMPRMDGPSLVREVREIYPQMKVIFISGYTEDTFRQRLDSDSGIDFLPKPFSLKQLATRVRDVLGVGLR